MAVVIFFTIFTQQEIGPVKVNQKMAFTGLKPRNFSVFEHQSLGLSSTQCTVMHFQQLQSRQE